MTKGRTTLATMVGEVSDVEINVKGEKDIGDKQEIAYII
jgi:hypothetical protein